MLTHVDFVILEKAACPDLMLPTKEKPRDIVRALR